jgi:hypothetical protein
VVEGEDAHAEGNGAGKGWEAKSEIRKPKSKGKKTEGQTKNGTLNLEGAR